MKKKSKINLNKILLKIGFFIYLVFLLAYSNAMAYEENDYEVVKKTEIYEIRKYSDRLAVQAKQSNQNSSFRKLFNYIIKTFNENLTLFKANKASDIMQKYIPI